MALTTANAPFGTEHTPNQTDIIIGGRYVSVLQRPPGQNAPRYEKLSLVSDKPNHVDPRTLTDFSQRYNKPYQDPFRSQPMAGRPTNFISKRPDSKDISSRYPTLPPIDENRLKNHQISTVFEPEAWTQEFRSGSSGKENLLMKYYNSSNGRSHDRGSQYREGLGPYGSRHAAPPPSPKLLVNRRGAPISKEEFVHKLTSMLPKNFILPDKPLLLSEEEETRLLQVLGEELRIYSPLKLRDIYLDIANSADKSLTGYCQYQELYHSMGRQMMSLSGDLLQATAAMFVSADRPNRDVNYEKFLSFLGLALKHYAQTGPFEMRPKMPVERQVDNYMSDSELAKLYSTVEQQLRENDYNINFSRLETELDRVDRLGKGELDQRTIMDVCFQLNIPLQSSILNRVLQRCRPRSYDDRYSWRVFVDFLSKAQPCVRQHSETHRFKPQSPNHQPPTQLIRHSSPPPPAPGDHRATVTPLWRRHDNPVQFNGPSNGYSEEQDTQTGVISRMDREIKQLEQNYEDIQGKLRPQNDAPWFKNFMEFASTLYNLDQKHQGNLPAEDVFQWTKMYNEVGNLGMSDHAIARALSDASKGGRVNIHTYLSKLGNVSRQDKIG